MQTLTKPLARYSHTRRVGNLVFVAGQGCRDSSTNSYRGVKYDAAGKILSYDITEQTKGVLGNIEAALQAIGLSRRNIVDVQVFLADMKDFPQMNAVWNEFFADAQIPPTRTTVQVVKLPGDNFVEMKSVAAVDA